MDHILNVARQHQQEIDMAKKKLVQPAREVAQIVVYRIGLENPIMVRYHDLKEAMRQFDKLLEAADHGRPILLKSGCQTCAIRFPKNIDTAYLIDVEGSNYLMADTQKRVNAMMAMPPV
jgi:hypothetical protein